MTWWICKKDTWDRAKWSQLVKHEKHVVDTECAVTPQRKRHKGFTLNNAFD